ncbi:3-methyl-2-oxobutanoate hydroxymethyltransferase [Psychromonas antarctica]|jgi:3-methyl-2-oxobutanoate hydroxymethyltransferase|uniref:3-methyl-2-oxobutanoate hydroxymethyltransferase n=1 Tax=Psychromonas antarctica TaxID=67573 RepID=UPI001EE990F2|nr:3-methyl-2-oxobutanoate hydroxymethyltransferase [Psychromonas antarctica]MCG6201033.1 3-methyl-2-oxobutanoate hydroxymethyltransferase [Psychromonas antarctica]
MTKISVSRLAKMKQENEKITCITAYDASFAAIFDQAGIQVLLIGDSLGMVLQGHDSTLPVTVDDIQYHTQSVARSASNALIISDLPFMSYATPQQSYQNAAILMRAGANMVKLEGGAWLAESVKGLVERGIPVCGHLGLTPQSVNVFGGYKVQGREDDQADLLIRDALMLEKSGIQLLVLECVPVPLAARVSKALQIPVIGIGAGSETDGQILVMHDAFGISAGFCPKFSKNFLIETGDIRSAVALYKEQVENGSFPSSEHSFY